jgi:endonuclease/exonuclease/phosphatase family metal-dependent hydrolase
MFQPPTPVGRHSIAFFPAFLRELCVLCGEISFLLPTHHRRRAFLTLTSLMFLLFSEPARAQESTIVHLESQTWPSSSAAAKNPDILSFDDLVTLSKTAEPTVDLAHRLDSLLNTPFLHEDTSAKHRRPNVANLGPVLRVAMWNIERGLNLDLIRAALTNPAKFNDLTSGDVTIDRGARHAAAEAQLQKLQDIDLLILNEADLGMKRTNYDDVTSDLASALHMNYAYGVEFIEVDPIFDLNSEEVHLPDAAEDHRLQHDLQVDRDKYHGLHGTAILSRYPLHNVRIFRLPVCYDWYATEYAAISSLEQGKRWSAKKLFDERIERELRHGGRMALIADISVPELPTGQATVVATHLENKCTPACRKLQMTALLDQLRTVQNPVILAGDFNTTSRDNTPTSIRNEIMKRITDYQFWIGQAISWFNPLGFAKLALYPLHYFHGYNDPTAYHLPIVWDNRERPLFSYIENFRFDDGRSFDLRGRKKLTDPQRARTLADSNQRQWKGFVPTYSFARDYGGVVGRFKLDWILVKPFTTNPRQSNQPLKFAPTYPTTMQELNSAPPDRISDHPPITVDLPLTEPPPKN